MRHVRTFIMDRRQSDQPTSDPATTKGVGVGASPGSSCDPDLARVFFLRRPGRTQVFNDSNRFHDSDLGESSSDPDTYRKSGFELRPNREWTEASLSLTSSGFAAF